jgi:hypothetical protein
MRFLVIDFRVEILEIGWKEIDGRQETGDRRQETGDKRPERRDGRQETGDRRQETGDKRKWFSIEFEVQTRLCQAEQENNKLEIRNS